MDQTEERMGCCTYTVVPGNPVSSEPVGFSKDIRIAVHINTQIGLVSHISEVTRLLGIVPSIHIPPTYTGEM